MRSRFVKRAIDVTLSSLLLVLAAPVLFLIAVLVLITMGRPVFFRQERPGLNGRSFDIVKFRTMRAPRFEGESGENRITALGRLLRKTSLDELPELWNVLRGDMSLVGPRPLLVKYLPLYSKTEARRHEVRPGITGLAQVSGRNALTWAQKFALDVEYVDNWTNLGDLAILFRTVVAVIRREGISHQGHQTMPEFTRERAGGE